MNRKINFIATLLLSLAISTPLALKANEPNDQPVIEDNIQGLTISGDNIENATTSFLELDDEARNELSQLGIKNPNDELAGQIIDYASTHLGRPYRSGAKGPSAFDCSGFTSYVFKNHGITLSPSSRTQYTQGIEIDRDEIRPGDLLFFSGRRGGKTVGHVALAVDVEDDGTVKFIHAATSKGIRYDKFPDGGYYSKRFIGARRVIE